MRHIAEEAMRWVFVLLLALVATASGGEARAEKRVALVIGNAAYQNTAALNNPSNDAADLSAALQRLDFEVIEGRDLDKRAMERLVRQFGIKLAGADVALFFYAGHGLQVGGQNYLVPIDAKLASEGDVDFESLPVSLVARQMEREAKTSLILLDACRDNPLSRNLARAMSTRSSQVGQGLAEVKTGVGTLIAFSTQPGYVALDGVGRNSPYAEALLKYIEAPGQDVSGVLVEVRNDVLKATGGKQVPWEHTSLTGQVYLKAGPASGSAAAGELAKLPAARGPDPELEIAFWNSVKDSKSPAVIEAYLERYPNGTFAGLAKVMVAQLKGAPVKAPEQATRVALPEVKPPDPRVLARSLQTELKRVGCDPGEIDGQWGDKGREALDQFGRHAKMSMPSQEPTAAALDAVTARKERVCPLECGKGTAEVEGKCVATESKTKKSKSASSSRSRERSSSSSEGSSSSGGGIIGGGGISIGIGGGRGRVGIGF
jgi:uncharacterized caspase-like protein